MTAPAPSPAPSAASARLNPSGFARVAALAKREAGLTIPETKQAMVQSRLSRRLRATGLNDFDSYLKLVESTHGVDERDHMISALTTNVSHFFREDHHFDTLRSTVLPPLIDRLHSGGRVRIWSAGCSSGQEPYSIAITLLEALPDAKRYDIRILATDIDRAILTKARAGRYDARQISGLNAERQRKFFTQGPDKDTWQVTPALQDLISFRRLNLIEPWPMRGQFDVIFCRNVVIYFNPQTQSTLWPRFAAALHPDAWFFLGHSERIQDGDAHLFRPEGVTSYRLPTSQPA
ncbi:MAG: protein-glutamate O-methyltransferase [Pseudomonadota bacterium]